MDLWQCILTPKEEKVSCDGESSPIEKSIANSQRLTGSKGLKNLLDVTLRQFDLLMKSLVPWQLLMCILQVFGLKKFWPWLLLVKIVDDFVGFLCELA